MWAPLPPEPPAKGWWTELAERAAQAEVDRWIDGVADGLRAERVEGLKAAAHRVDMKAAGALSADRWNRIQRRQDQRYARYHHGYLVGSWGARPEVEMRGGGRVLGVR